MKVLRLAAVAALALALLPEWTRYRAERSLFRVSSAVLLASRDPGNVPGGTRTLLHFAEEGRAAARALPCDSRPLLAVSSLERLAGRPAESRDVALRALADGERPEILLAVWRADEALGLLDESRAALLRAAWLTPALVALLPGTAPAEALDAVREIEAALVGPDSSRDETEKRLPPPALRR